MTQTRRFLLDAASNYLRMLATILGTIFVTRAMALRWGLIDFGRWSLITTVMSLSLLLDLGLSNVVLKAAGDRDDPHNSEKLSSVFVALLVISCFASIGLWCASCFILPDMNRSLLLATFMLSLRATVASLPWTVCRSALYARDKMSITNFIQATGVLAYSGTACYLLYRGTTFSHLALASLAFTVLDSLALVILLRNLLRDLRLRIRFHYEALKPLLSLGSASFLINISGFVLLKTDPLIVKLFLPLSQVALYAVALRIAESIFLLCKQLVNALTPHAVRVGTAADPKQRAVLFEKASLYVMALGTPVYVSTLLLGRAGIRLWLSREYESSATILNVLLLAMILSIPQLVASNLLTFCGSHAKTATFITIGTFINLAASITLVRVIGAMGIAYGTLMSTLVIDVAVMVPIACRHFQLRFRHFVFTIGKGIGLPAAIQASVLLYTSRHFYNGSPLNLLFEALVGFLAFLVMFIFLGITRDERRKLNQAIFGPDRHVLLTTEAA